jgi:Methyl-accepting chemotaxis protein (MCP) signalling domain
MLRNFRIGTSFIVSGAMGVLLVAGMVANEQFSNRGITNLNAALANQHDIQMGIMRATVDLRRAQMANKDIRLATTREQLNQAIEALQASGTDASGNLQTAIQKAVIPENRERMNKVIALFHDYLGAVNEVAAKQGEILNLWEKRKQAGNAWVKSLDAAAALPALQAAQSRAEIESSLRQADLAFFDARNAAWRYAVTGEPELIERMAAAADKAIGFLKSARAASTDKAIAGAIDDLSSALLAFRSVVDTTTKTIEVQRNVLRERTLPVANEISTLMDKIAGAADHLAEEKTATVAAEMAQAGWVGIGIGGIVVLMLIVTNMISGRSVEKRKMAMRSLADTFESTIGTIVGTVSSASTELEAAATTLTQTAETTQQLTAIVASASEEASSNVQSVASASEQLAGSVNEIGRQVQESSRIANEAVEQAKTTDARIVVLSQAANRIGAVVKLITAIAEQTNLLALNATIEAARAGEAGRGFAVVASEVKSLANQTAKATDEIGNHIAAIQAATSESVVAIKEIGTTINRISEIAGAIAAAVEEQGSATQEIARNVQEAAQGTTQVATNISDVNRGAGETGAASGQVLLSARELSNEGSRLKIEVDKFLVTVRAA